MIVQQQIISLKLRCELAIQGNTTQKGGWDQRQASLNKTRKEEERNKMQRIFLKKNIYGYNCIELFLYILPFLVKLRKIILKPLSLSPNKHFLLSISCRVTKQPCYILHQFGFSDIQCILVAWNRLSCVIFQLEKFSPMKSYICSKNKIKQSNV